MNSIGSKWEINDPTRPPEFITLVEKVGLTRSPNIESNHTEVSLEVLLRNWGPIWCAGY